MVETVEDPDAVALLGSAMVGHCSQASSGFGTWEHLNAGPAPAGPEQITPVEVLTPLDQEVGMVRAQDDCVLEVLYNKNAVDHLLFESHVEKLWQ